MKTLKNFMVGLLVLASVLSLAFSFPRVEKALRKTAPFVPPKGCVFRTVMGEESSDSSFIYKTSSSVNTSVGRGLAWIAQAQNDNGGWGAGSHSRQQVMDPHAVPADPATTAMVAMALLRSGSTLTQGEYASHLRKALDFLLQSAEQSPENRLNITDLTGTQIQTKLGANIDVVLTAQFFANLMDQLTDETLRSRVTTALARCVDKIERAQNGNGSMAGAGWAGVLQSSFATNALEAAQANGIAVDDSVLASSRDYQKQNYDPKTGNVNTDMGAGVLLYSVTGSARASAKEARKVKEDMERARHNGQLAPGAEPSTENLVELGYTPEEAIRHVTAYQVYESAKVQAQREDVLAGFGNNGGEEFLSYLQTGESMIIGKDSGWKRWYDNMSGRLLSIQNDDGSWNGHHCITSPVFCTATCLLILSVNNDVEKLIRQGDSFEK